MRKRGEDKKFFDDVYRSCEETKARIVEQGLYPNEAFEFAYEQYLRPPQQETRSDDVDVWD